MKTYSVKEIAEMLNTNPETVRRLIRDKKLDATIESKKGGHIVYEAALQEFLKSSPKYAAVAKASLAGAIGAAVLPTVPLVILISPLALLRSLKMNLQPFLDITVTQLTNSN